jgi:hypothetical protein
MEEPVGEERLPGKNGLFVCRPSPPRSWSRSAIRQLALSMPRGRRGTGRRQQRSEPTIRLTDRARRSKTATRYAPSGESDTAR